MLQFARLELVHAQTKARGMLKCLFLFCTSAAFVLLSDRLWTYKLLFTQYSVVSLSHAYARNEHVDSTQPHHSRVSAKSRVNLRMLKS